MCDVRLLDRCGNLTLPPKGRNPDLSNIQCLGKDIRALLAISWYVSDVVCSVSLALDMTELFSLFHSQPKNLLPQRALGILSLWSSRGRVRLQG